MKNFKEITILILLLLTLVLSTTIVGIIGNIKSNIQQPSIFNNTDITIAYDLEIIDAFSNCQSIEYDKELTHFKVFNNTFTLPANNIYISQTTKESELLVISGSYEDIYTIAILIKQGKNFNHLLNTVRITLALKLTCLEDIHKTITKEQKQPSVPRGQFI